MRIPRPFACTVMIRNNISRNELSNVSSHVQSVDKEAGVHPLALSGQPDCYQRCALISNDKERDQCFRICVRSFE